MKPITILMADDDAEDRQFTREAFEESRLANDFRTVEDGVELLDYLHRRGPYAENGAAPVTRSMFPSWDPPRGSIEKAPHALRGAPRLGRTRVPMPARSS